LTGLPFTQESLRAETPKILRETDYTEKNFATHKFALAAWNQGVRHGRLHAGVRADVSSALLAEVQAYRDEHLAVLSNTLVCVVGGVPHEQAWPILEKELGGIRTTAKLRAPVGATAQGDLQLTWDLGVRHVVLTWPLPDRGSPDYAALWLGAQVLMMRFSMDSTMNALTGTALAGVDLVTPEERCFYVTATLRPQADEGQAREKLLSHVARLGREELPSGQVRMMTTQAADWIRSVPDLAEVRKQAPQVPAAVLEANLALQWATQRYRHPAEHQQLAQHLAELRGAHIKSAASSYLGPDKVRTCWMRPTGSSSSIP
jgi:hypothetical protein